MQNQAALGSASIQYASRDSIERLSYVSLYVFALMLYLRPQEMFPSVFGTFPLVKSIAIFGLATFVLARLRLGQQITIWPVELKMLAILIGLSLALIPFATSPDDSLMVLGDPLVKVLAIFVLMINLIDTRQRLISVLKVVVIVSSFMALAAIRSYLAGEFSIKSTRIVGMVNGQFGNPNDLATSLDLIIPFALALALISRGRKRVFYVLCATALTAGVVVTFSRGGFLGLVAMALFFVWKLGRFRKGATTVIVVATVAVFAAAIPAGYSGRLGSILNSEQDSTGSAQARLDLLGRASEVAASHPLIGVGLGNYHIFSIGEQKAHNSYLEIAAELGLGGLLAYLVILIAPFRYLRRIEKESVGGVHAGVASVGPGPARDLLYLSITIQGALIGYAVCSFFGSIQYFWYLYLIVAYALSLKTLSESAGESQRDVVPAAPEAGALWSRRPAFQKAH